MTTIDPSVEVFAQLSGLDRGAALAALVEMDRDTRTLIAEGAWPRLTAERRLHTLVGLHVALHGEAAAVRAAHALIQAIHGSRQRLERRGASHDWTAPLFTAGAPDGWDRGATERVVGEAFTTYRWTSFSLDAGAAGR